MKTNRLTLCISSLSLLISLCLGFVCIAQEPNREEPTVIEFGKFTRREHAYSKEFKSGDTDAAGQMRRFVEETKERGDTEMGMGGLSCCGNSENSVPISAQTFLRILSCQTDAVVLGTAKRTGAHLIDDESFVYTAYDFKIKEIFRNNEVNPIKVGKTIEVTRSGGIVRLDGITIGATPRGYRFLDPSSEYVLFLRYIPAADGYMVSSEDGDFRIDGDSYEGISSGCGGSDLPRKGETWTLLTTLRNAVSLGCEKSSKEGKEK